SQAPVRFSMDPEIAGSEYGNPLTGYNFTAKDCAAAADAGYVTLATNKEHTKLLRVDTAYHNAAKDARYELRLKVDEIDAPRAAYVYQNLETGRVPGLVASVIKGLSEQTKFRFQYNPSEQSVMIQAKQYVYLNKDAKAYWWQVLDKVADVTFPTAAAVTEGTAPTVGKTEVDQVGANIDGYTYIKSVAVDTWNNNLIKLTTLTTSPKHSEVTVGYDARDEKYHGINTLIQLGAYAQKEAAYINSGYYYIQNGNKVTRDLMPSNYYRYHDLAATNKTQTQYDSSSDKWVVGNEGFVADPSIVYSEELLKAIPAAQWYIAGDAGFYTITNRESNQTTSALYLWKVKDENGKVVANTYACKGFGATEELNDTIVIAPVPAMDMHMGYLNLSAAEAAKETEVFNFQFATLGSDPMNVTYNANNELLVSAADGKQFKLERVKLYDVDEYTDKLKEYPVDLGYGFSSDGYKKDALKRAMYYIYEYNVSSETSEGTGKRTRNYVTLEGAKYVMKQAKVTVDEDGYTYYDPEENAKVDDFRKAFYIKNISNVENEFVLIDPETTATSDPDPVLGVRAFVNQSNGLLQPAGLRSQGATNVYDNSVLTFARVTLYNYRDIRKEANANDVDTLVFHKATNANIKLYETAAEGANITLLARDNHAQFDKNFAFFIDTVNTDPVKPTFLIGLRPTKFGEAGSNIDSHNRHFVTVADYLTVLTDSAKVNAAYKDVYGNVRLGFVHAAHRTVGNLNDYFVLADKEAVASDLAEEIIYEKGGDYDLTKDVCPAVFAFRYVDTTSDNFYIEGQDHEGKRIWVKTINEVPVVVNDIKEAEIFNVAAAETAPTANEAVADEVSVVAA
ncbi:MAG: hypothetical protein SPE11_13400, partial [Parabacteroides sp.]|nr:hypothetical protein [Parabacteroides sp.]